MLGCVSERISGLGEIVSHYSHEPETITGKQMQGCAVVRIDIDSLTGKARE